MTDLLQIPTELREERRWVTWAYERRGPKTTKRPHQAISDPSTWLTFREATKRWHDNPRISGVGFVLGDGRVGIDLDHAIAPDGTLHAMARDAIALGTYTETSPGGQGVHLWIRATISKSRKLGARGGVPGREIYDGREGSARFFTVTGDRLGDVSEIREGPLAQAALDAFIAKWLPEEPQPVQNDNQADDGENAVDDDRLLEVMFGAADGAKWRAVFGGDCTAYPSQSEADFALCRKFRFYTNANADQIDRLFRRSVLLRAKWDERHGAQTYGELHDRGCARQGWSPLQAARSPRH